MADMSRLTMLDGTVVQFKDAVARRSMVEYIKGTQNGPTNRWTGNSVDTELTDGKQISYFLPFECSGNPALDLTLAAGDRTGPKDVLMNGLDAIDFTLPANSVIRLTWIESSDSWVTDAKSTSEVVSYDDLSDKPQIESVTLQSNKTFEQLGLKTMTNSEIEAILNL